MATVVSLKDLPGPLSLARQRLPLVELVCLLMFVVAADIVNVVLSVLRLLFCVSLSWFVLVWMLALLLVPALLVVALLSASLVSMVVH